MNDIERKRVEKAVATFLEKHRPPVHLRDQVDLAFRFDGRSVEILVAEDEQKPLLSKLGPHKMSKSCLHFKRLADLDRSVLQQLVAGSVAKLRRRYE